MMLFHQLETPVSVYHTMRWDFMSWHCVAAMSEQFLDPLTNTDPLIRSRSDRQTSYHRALCIVYARSHYMPRMTPTIVAEHNEQMMSHGLADDILSDDDFERVVKCLTLEDEDTSVCTGSFRLRSAAASEACRNFLKTQCL